MNYQLTRRELLKVLSGSLITGNLSNALTPGGAHGRDSPKNIRWAQGWLLWRGFKGQALTLKDALENLNAVGADGIEFSPGSSELVKQGLTKESLKEFLGRMKLAISGNYFSAPFYDHGRREEIFQEAQRRFDLLKEFGAKNMIIGPPDAAKEGTADRLKLIKQQVPVLNELGKRAVDQGIQIGIHPHLNTLVESPPEIDAIMEATDPRYVFFSPDTGHIHLAGGDLLAILRKYKSRLNYFHFKDGVRPFVRPDFIPNLRELGQGEVEFPAVMRLLKEIRYRGWINVEQDQTRLTPKQASEISMAYVRRTLMPIYS